MTMREVDFSLSRIGVRKHNAYAARAALHGHKMKPLKGFSREVFEIDSEKSKTIDKLMREAMKLRGG